MELDPHVLSDVHAWGRPLEGFTAQHARSGLAYAQCVATGVPGERGEHVAGVGRGDARSLFLLAIDTACCALWIDDCFDLCVDGATTAVDLPALLASAAAPPTTREGQGFHLLAEQFKQAAGADSAAYDLWVDTALATFCAFQESALASRGAAPYSYAEHLQNGEHSIAVTHSMASISLLCGFDMAARRGDLLVGRMLRNLSLTLRLENDLMSVEVERANKIRANAVLIMEAFLPRGEAIRFVKAQAAGHRRLLERDFEALGHRDPLVRAARVLWAATYSFYAESRNRYTPAAPEQR